MKEARSAGDCLACSACVCMKSNVGEMPRPGFAARHVFSLYGSASGSQDQITP